MKLKWEPSRTALRFFHALFYLPNMMSPSCPDHRCWEQTMNESWLSVIVNMSFSDLLSRITFCLLIWKTLSHSKKPEGFNSAIALSAGVMVFGNIVSAAFVAWTVLSQLTPTAGFKSLPLPRFAINADTICMFVLTSWAIYLRCFDLSNPKYLIFDEVHFGKFMNGHITGEFYFDIHPPWVKLIMAGFTQHFTPWYKV
jgi:hypothetical protein